MAVEIIVPGGDGEPAEVVVPPRGLAYRDLSNVENSDFYNKGIESGLGTGGGGIGGSFTYAWNPADPENSLGHSVERLSVDKAYAVAFFESDQRVGAHGVWQLVATVGDGTGAVTQAGGYLFLDGVGSTFVKILSEREDAASIGGEFLKDSTADNKAKLELLATISEATDVTVVATGEMTATETINLGRGRYDLGGLTIYEPEASAAINIMTLTGGSIGSVHKSAAHIEGTNRVPDPDEGQYDWGGTPNGDAEGVPSQATGVLWGPDGQGSSTRSFEVHRLFRGVMMTGNTEKQGDIHVAGTANTILFQEEESGTGSPDTNVIHLSGAYNKHALVTANNTSGHYLITHEARLDDGTFITDPTHYLYDSELAALGQPVPTPGIWVRSGKFHWIDIHEWRAMNGRTSILIHKNGDSGADTAKISGTMVDNMGVSLWVNTIQRLAGDPLISDNKNGRNNYASSTDDYLCPAVLLGRINDPSGFAPTINRCLNQEGFLIGNIGVAGGPAPVLSDGTVGFYSTNVDLVLAGSMSEYVDGVPTHMNPSKGWFPRNATHTRVARMEGGSIFYPTIDGNIVLNAGAQGVTLSIPASFIDKGYNIDDAAAYQCHVDVRGKTKFSHIGHKPFFETTTSTLRVDAISDYGGAPVGYDGAFTTSNPFSVTTAQLSSITSDINWKFKKTGLQAYNVTTGLMMVASGPAQADPWNEVNGAASITPVKEANLDALLARMTSAPTVGQRWYNIYNRILNDWADILPDCGRFQLLGAHDAQASLLDWTNPANNATVNGTVNFQAGIGYTGNGEPPTAGPTGYISSAFVPGSIGDTVSNQWVHAHVLGLGAVTNGDLVGSDTKTVRLRAAHGSSNRAEVGTTAIHAWAAAGANRRSIAASTVSSGVSVVWDNGQLRETNVSAVGTLPGSIDLLRGYDPVGGLYRYSDDTLMLFAYGKDATDDRMALMASLSDDISYMIGAV